MANLLGRYSQAQLKDAQQLLDLYQQRESVREFIKNRLNEKKAVSWKGRALIFYCQLFSQVAQSQVNLLAQDQPRLGEKYKKQYDEAKKDPKQFTTFLSNYIEDERKHHLFKNTVTNWEKEGLKPVVNPIIPDEIDRMPEGPEKFKKTEAFVFQADKEIEKEEQKQVGDKKQVEGTTQAAREAIPTKTEAPITNAPRTFPSLALRERLGPLILKVKQLKAPSFVKDLSTNAQIAAKKFISRFPSQIAGGVVGAVIGGIKGGPYGAAAGAVGGVTAATIIQTYLEGNTFPPSLNESGAPDYLSAFSYYPITGGAQTDEELGTPEQQQANNHSFNRPSLKNLNRLRKGLKGSLRKGLVRAGARSGLMALLANPVVLAILGVVILIPLLFILISLIQTSSMFPPSGMGTTIPPVSGGQINSCTFTRAGSKAQLKSSALSGWISEAASRHQIPTAILASVVYHENPSLFPETNDHDAFKNNYYYFVNPEGETRAIGLSQISVGRTPIKDKDGNIVIVDHCKSLLASDGSFTKAADSLGKKIMDQDYYCVDDVDERVRRFCQTDTAVTGKAFYTPPDNKSDNSYLNLCQLTDNLEVGAVHLVGKLGGGSWDKQDDVTKAISGYYGKCDYGGGNYCAEVWSDYQGCQNTPTPGSGIIDTIVQWAKTITSKLDKTSTDKLLTPVTNNNGYTTGNWSGGGYACTYLVVDAYNLAGVSGLTKADHGWVVNMEKFWKNSSSLGYTYLDYQKDNQVLRQVKLGYVMFQEEKPGTITGNEHASIVQEKNIDNATGNGYIKTYDSNAGTHIEWKYTVTDWDILNNFNPHEIITGFGGY